MRRRGFRLGLSMPHNVGGQWQDLPFYEGQECRQQVYTNSTPIATMTEVNNDIVQRRLNLRSLWLKMVVQMIAKLR